MNRYNVLVLTYMYPCAAFARMWLTFCQALVLSLSLSLTHIRSFFRMCTRLSVSLSLTWLHTWWFCLSVFVCSLIHMYCYSIRIRFICISRIEWQYVFASFSSMPFIISSSMLSMLLFTMWMSKCVKRKWSSRRKKKYSSSSSSKEIRSIILYIHTECV